jgi:hypothetical protein
VLIHTSFPRDVQGTADMVRSIGRALHRRLESKSIADDIEARATRVRASAKGKREVSFAYLIWRKPWMAVNGDTFAHALLAQAGGRNVFADRAERLGLEPDDLERASQTSSSRDRALSFHKSHIGGSRRSRTFQAGASDRGRYSPGTDPHAGGDRLRRAPDRGRAGARELRSGLPVVHDQEHDRHEQPAPDEELLHRRVRSRAIEPGHRHGLIAAQNSTMPCSWNGITRTTPQGAFVAIGSARWMQTTA